MDLIKKGNRNITFIGCLTKNKEEFVRVIVKNNLGSKDEVVYKCKDGFSNLRSTEWEYIKKAIKEKSYES